MAHLKIAVLGSEKIIFGFLIAGFSPEDNFMIPFEQDFTKEDLTDSFQNLLTRSDLGLVSIAEDLMFFLEKEIEKHKNLLPSIVKIPAWH